MSKRILHCSDGTWNEAVGRTNVYKLFKAMYSSAEQIRIYDDGSGSDGTNVTALLGGAFGEGLDRKILETYTIISFRIQSRRLYRALCGWHDSGLRPAYSERRR
jgi:uncharacterized protein (DUF2235 family)